MVGDREGWLLGELGEHGGRLVAPVFVDLCSRVFAAWKLEIYFILGLGSKLYILPWLLPHFITVPVYPFVQLCVTFRPS